MYTTHQQQIIDQVNAKVDAFEQMMRRTNGAYAFLTVFEHADEQNIILHYCEGKQEGEEDDWRMEKYLIVCPDGRWSFMNTPEWRTDSVFKETN
jgi:hypothetical protein